MSKHLDTTIPLEPHTFYHLFNRGNKGQRIYYQERNYGYFLKKYDEYLSGYLDTYAYVLIPNHFHLLVRIKSKEDIIKNLVNDYEKVSKSVWKTIREKAEEYPDNLFKEKPAFSVFIKRPFPKESVSMESFVEMMPLVIQFYLACWVLSDRFRRFFAGYARAINKQQGDIGTLFQKPFRRKIIDSEAYLTCLIWYIHRNGAHHGLCEHFADYTWSSYHRILMPKQTKLMKEEILDWFGGKMEYKSFHEKLQMNQEALDKVLIEEDGCLKGKF